MEKRERERERESKSMKKNISMKPDIKCLPRTCFYTLHGQQAISQHVKEKVKHLHTEIHTHTDGHQWRERAREKDNRWRN